MKPLEALNRGDLDEALRLAKQSVAATPGDVPARYVLAELLCFTGEFERADAQLDAAAPLDPNHAVAVNEFRQIVRAEVARQDFHARGRVPEFWREPDEALRERLVAAVALRAGDRAGAAAALGRAEARRTALSVRVGDDLCDDIRDGDDLLGDVLELLTQDGRYFWAPFSALRRLSFQPVQRARDLLFREARIEFIDGMEGTVYIPVLYAGSAGATEPDLRLGRATDWRGAEPDPIRGVGQRVLLTPDRDYGVLELTTLEFANDAGGAAV